MPAPVGLDAGTASQLIRGVRRTNGRERRMPGAARRPTEVPCRILSGG
jgi:hypothetical protein